MPEPASTDSRSLSITWELDCSSGACVGERQASFQVRVRDDGRVIFDSGRRVSDVPQNDADIGTLRSARQYAVEVVVWTTGNAAPFNASAAFRTAVLGEWQGEWLGEFTQLRGDFALNQPTKAVASAFAHASGVGCFALTVNGRPASSAEANASYMDPGWSNVPTVRMLYRQYDVSSLLQDGGNVLGARLGQCKYGYQGSFCAGAHGSTATCRAFSMNLVIRYADGSEQTVLTQSGGGGDGATRWLGTNELNPIRYTHLYHGETVDGTIGDRAWDTPEVTPTVGPAAWQPAQPYPLASQLGPPSLLTAPPIAATDALSAVSVTPIGIAPSPPDPTVVPCSKGAQQARVVGEGGSLSFACAAGGTIGSLYFARYGYTNASAGRFIGVASGVACADPKFRPGCIFWERSARIHRP
jgi:hypothetical protein